jgi:hypothetical protein
MVISWVGRWKIGGGLDLHDPSNTFTMIDDMVFAEGGMPRVHDGVEVNGGSFDNGNIDNFRPEVGLAKFGFTKETLPQFVLFNWERVAGWPNAEPWLVKAIEAVRELRDDTFIYLYDPRDQFRWEGLVDGYMCSMNNFNSRGPRAWFREMTARGLGCAKVIPLVSPLNDPTWRETMWRIRTCSPEEKNLALWGVAGAKDTATGEAQMRTMAEAQRYWEELRSI